MEVESAFFPVVLIFKYDCDSEFAAGFCVVKPSEFAVTHLNDRGKKCDKS